MFRNWTFGRKIAAGFAISAIALIVVAATGYRSTKLLISNDELVAHTHQVRAQIAELLVQMLNAETGQRGFVITADDAYLQPYLAGVAAVDSTFSELRRLTADNPSEQSRLDRMRPHIDAKLAELKRTVDQRRTSLEQTTAIVAGGEGKREMDAVRQLLVEMDQEEARLLDTRAHEAEASTSLATAVIVWGSVGAIVITIIAGWFITSSLTKQVGTAARNSQTSATELQTAANQQASGAAEQATAMSEIATTINELLTTSKQIADSAQRVAQIANETTATARLGNATVGKGSDAIATVRKQVDAIVAHMLELGRKSQQVGAVLDIVSELAEQTNILAINASIEAAGAGEAGRRFGVVADEIRNLADRVGASTKEIRTMIEDVRGAVNTSVMATEAGSKAVDVSGGQVIEMATAFTQISKLVSTTTEAAREIELSTKQQATAVEQVNVAITNVAQASRESETSTAQTLQTAGELSMLATRLLQIVQSG
jgi:methyl-accepting chemotaxis protein